MNKILKTASKQYGPYASITRDESGYLCDGILFPDVAIGDVEIIETDKPVFDPVAWRKLRQRRNELLSESDVYVMADRWDRYTYDQKEAWSEYRQKLRDLPEATIDPVNPVWPVIPPNI